MGTRNRTASTIAAVAMAILVLTTTSGNAATMSSGPTVPDIGSFDIASYGTPTGIDKWWPGTANDFGNPGMTIGQTFTTGSVGVLLNAFTFRVRDFTEPVKTYTIRIGSVSGSTFTEIASEPVTQSFSTATDDYWTWTFDFPVVLSANTIYGVDVGINTSTSDWTTGIPYVYYTGDIYADGTRFRSGSDGYGVGDTSMDQMSGDRVFHIDMRYADPNLPTVDLGGNWVIWSGETLALDPNVVDNNVDPHRSLSYAWTASPSDGVVFTPNAGVEAPLVTITKATDNPSTITLTLAVTLEGEDPRSDTMRLYVYDDACQAGKGTGSVVIGAGDFNGSCFTDIEDFAILATAWLVDYDVADLSMLSETWLDANILTAPVTTSVTVPDVTDGSESAAQSILTGLGLTTSSAYQFDLEIPSNDVISQSPIAGTEVPDGINVSLVVSKGLPPVTELLILGVYLAQTHVLEPYNPLFKLVGNRPALLKVQVVAPDGIAAPPVTALLSVDSETTTLTLDGPDTLPDAFQAELGLVQHRHDDSFTTLIPAEWIRPGLSIEVTAGSVTVDHDIKVGAPTELKMKMFDIHYFGLGDNDYPAGTFEELEAKWPAASLDIERIRDIDFLELVIPARAGAPNVRVTSTQDYYDQTGLSFDGEQAAALQWVEALSASGGNFDVAMQYINIIGVPAGGQAGGFDGVGGISLGILHHELGHALSLPHWGDDSSYPYKGDMYGIEPQPGVYMETHVGPTWAFDLPSMIFIPPTVQEDSVGGEVGYYKKSPMQGGGTGDQEVGFFFRHFSDFGVNRMQGYIEGKVAVLIGGNYYKWNDGDGDYTTSITSDGVRYPIEQDVQVISVMASTTLSDMNVNMVYPPIGPYEGNLILTFDPTSASDRAAADDVFCPDGGCDFTLRVMQGGEQKTYMLAASGTEGGDPYSSSSLKTAAVNLRASDGTVTQVELLLTPDAEVDGLPSTPQVLYTWTE